MKKILISAICVVAGASLAADTAKVTYRKAPLSTPTTNVVTFTAANGRVTEPVLFVSKTAVATNTPVITVVPASGTGAYTVYTGSAQIENTTVVVNMNSELPLGLSSTTDGTNVLSVTQTASPRVILLPGDVLTITGTAAVWDKSTYYMQIKETLQ